MSMLSPFELVVLCITTFSAFVILVLMVVRVLLGIRHLRHRHVVRHRKLSSD